jgi:hypothetical protein
MKSYAKVLSILLGIACLPAIAAEAPKPTFPIWGGPSHDPIGYYNVIKALTGQEFVGITAKCFDGGEGGLVDTYVLKAPIYDAVTGTWKYDVVFSVDSNNTTPQSEECVLSYFGQGIAVSGNNRIIILGAVGGDGKAVVSAYNAETGSLYYTKKFDLVDSENYSLEIYNEHCSVGNFTSTKADQLRVTYTQVGENATLYKVSYYDVVTGNQIGNTLSINTPAPVLPAP